MTNFPKNYFEKTIELWQPYSKEKPTLDDANGIVVNAVTSLEVIIKWIEKDRTQKQEPKPDYCPACEGLGFIPVKVKRNIYGYESTYDEGFACPDCLTGMDKKERIGLPLYKERPGYRFINSCHEEYTREIDK